MKQITNEEYNGLVRQGFVATNTKFIVGKEYEIKSKGKSNLKVRCQQNCPTVIRILNSF